MLLNIVLIFLAALVLSLIVRLVYRNPGPWKSFWAFLAVLFLGMWAFSLWVTPVGPVWHDFARLDTLLLGLLLALLLGAAGEQGTHIHHRTRDFKGELDLVAEAKREHTSMFGVFFWIFVLTLVVLVSVGLIYTLQIM